MQGTFREEKDKNALKNNFTLGLDQNEGGDPPQFISSIERSSDFKNDNIITIHEK